MSMGLARPGNGTGAGGACVIFRYVQLFDELEKHLYLSSDVDSAVYVAEVGFDRGGFDSQVFCNLIVCESPADEHGDLKLTRTYLAASLDISPLLGGNKVDIGASEDAVIRRKVEVIDFLIVL